MMLGIYEWDESMAGGDRNWERNVGATMSYLQMERKTPNQAALVGTAEAGSHVLHHPHSLSFVFPHMDVIASNLSGFVK